MDDRRLEYYKKHYQNMHYEGILGLFTSGYHRRLEKPHRPQKLFSHVLEIGGGTGEHLYFVKHDFEAYSLLDISEDIEGLQRVKSDPRESRVGFVLADATHMPFEDNQFDRILSTCVLHHIPNLETALAEIRRVAKPGAQIDFYLPCDPGLLYRWVRHWTSHRKQKKSMALTSVEVKYLWALEHRNHFLGVLSLIKGIYTEDQLKIERYPFRFFSWNFNLYSVIRITVN
jgi:ubiquinone/menaquinone biosynthesis C-methylase UbiE